jgi:hypothetical protein
MELEAMFRKRNAIYDLWPISPIFSLIPAAASFSKFYFAPPQQKRPKIKKEFKAAAKLPLYSFLGCSGPTNMLLHFFPVSCRSDSTFKANFFLSP